MITQARAARASIVVSGKDYASALAPYFISMTFTDNYDGEKADDFSLQLADRDRRFISDWMPDKGTFLDAAIIVERWFAPFASGLSLDCGRFWIDTVEFKLPQHTVEIKATSIPTDAHIKSSDETRGWEDQTLHGIADEIAQENKMQVDWKSDYNPRYSHVELVEESGLGFLKTRAQDAKIAIKVARGKILFYDEEKLEAQPPAFTLVYGNIPAGTNGLASYRISGGHFTTKINDTTKKATVSHTSMRTGKMSKGFAESSDPQLESDWNQNVPQGTDEVDQDEDNEGDGGNGGNGTRRVQARDFGGDPNAVADWSGGSGSSTRLAQAKVRAKNKEKDKCKIEMAIGNPLVAAGQTCMILGVGQFDGKWFIESAHHTVGPEYKTELTVRRCLQGI